MARPPKPLKLIETEKKSHRTKAEKDTRRKAEAGMLSGKTLSEWKSVKGNPIAHAEYKRLRKLLAAMEKSDAIYANVINRYCLLFAECLHYEQLRNKFEQGLEDLETYYAGDGVDKEDFTPREYYKQLQKLRESITKLDKNLADKRRMMLDIERENAMTIAAALRAIPKKPQEEAEPDPMAQLLGSRRG